MEVESLFLARCPSACWCVVSAAARGLRFSGAGAVWGLLGGSVRGSVGLRGAAWRRVGLGESSVGPPPWGCVGAAWGGVGTAWRRLPMPVSSV